LCFLERADLVTKNTYVYESFSEDEESDVPKGKKSAPTSNPTKAVVGGEKKKGKASAAGQKNLMSFFGNK
jgi:DNA polymerase subunit Cdc27